MSEIHIHIHLPSEGPRRPKMSTSMNCRKCGKIHVFSVECKPEDVKEQMAKAWATPNMEADGEEARGLSKYHLWKKGRGGSK